MTNIMLGSDVEVCGDNVGRGNICYSCRSLRAQLEAVNKRLDAAENLNDEMWAAINNAADTVIETNNRWIALRDEWRVRRGEK